MIKNLINSFKIYTSPKYAMQVATNFWSKTTITHGSMEVSEFDFFFTNLKQIIKLNTTYNYLDFGGGNGELAHRFASEGYSFSHCDISEQMVANAINKYNLTSCQCKQLANTKKYDVILVHNAIFYIHPKLLKQHLTMLTNLLNPNGTIYITDTPDFNKRHICYSNFIKTLITNFIPVYQVNMAGFFIKDKQIKRICKTLNLSSIKSDSWCDYRSHWTLKKQ